MNKEFRRKLAEDLEGLFYQSETDAPFALADFEKVRQVTFNQFFAHLIKKEYWMNAEEKAVADRFRKLKGFIDANIKRKRVYKIGIVNAQILILGVDLSGDPILISTFATET